MSEVVAAVVVTCNSAAEIETCLRSLMQVAEIVVIDNNSSDSTCEAVERAGNRVRLIANPENRGFAAACNQGVQATSSPLVLFFNPDAELVDDLASVVEEFQAADVGAVGGRLVDRGGRTQVGFNVRRFSTGVSLLFEALLVNRLWPGNPVNRRFRCLDLDYTQAQDVEQPAGAFLMVRRTVLQAIGFWDERFFPLWFEDVDLCRRIQAAGYRIRYTPRCMARHRGAHSLAGISLEQRTIYWYRNLLRYSEKYFSPPAQALMRVGVFLGAVLRFLAAFARGEGCRSYSKVMVLAFGRQVAEARQVQPHVLT